MVDIYELFGIPRDADERQIKAAYRELVRECHPDHRPDDPEAAEFFKLVQAAFETLTDPEARAEYDACLDAFLEEQRLAREARFQERQRRKARAAAWQAVRQTVARVITWPWATFSRAVRLSPEGKRVVLTSIALAALTAGGLHLYTRENSAKADKVASSSVYLGSTWSSPSPTTDENPHAAWYPGPGQTAVIYHEIPGTEVNGQVHYVTATVPFGFRPELSSVSPDFVFTVSGNYLEYPFVPGCAIRAIDGIPPGRLALQAAQRHVDVEMGDGGRRGIKAYRNAEWLGVVKRGRGDYLIYGQTVDQFGGQFVVFRLAAVTLGDRPGILVGMATLPASLRDKKQHAVEDILNSFNVVVRPKGWTPEHAYRGPWQ